MTSHYLFNSPLLMNTPALVMPTNGASMPTPMKSMFQKTPTTMSLDFSPTGPLTKYNWTSTDAMLPPPTNAPRPMTHNPVSPVFGLLTGLSTGDMDSILRLVREPADHDGHNFEPTLPSTANPASKRKSDAGIDSPLLDDAMTKKARTSMMKKTTKSKSKPKASAQTRAVRRRPKVSDVIDNVASIVADVDIPVQLRKQLDIFQEEYDELLDHFDDLCVTYNFRGATKLGIATTNVEAVFDGPVIKSEKRFFKGLNKADTEFKELNEKFLKMQPSINDKSFNNSVTFAIKTVNVSIKFFYTSKKLQISGTTNPRDLLFFAEYSRRVLELIRTHQPEPGLDDDREDDEQDYEVRNKYIPDANADMTQPFTLTAFTVQFVNMTFFLPLELNLPAVEIELRKNDGHNELSCRPDLKIFIPPRKNNKQHTGEDHDTYDMEEKDDKPITLLRFVYITSDDDKPGDAAPRIGNCQTTTTREIHYSCVSLSKNGAVIIANKNPDKNKTKAQVFTLSPYRHTLDFMFAFADKHREKFSMSSSSVEAGVTEGTDDRVRSSPGEDGDMFDILDMD